MCVQLFFFVGNPHRKRLWKTRCGVQSNATTWRWRSTTASSCAWRGSWPTCAPTSANRPKTMRPCWTWRWSWRPRSPPTGHYWTEGILSEYFCPGKMYIINEQCLIVILCFTGFKMRWQNRRFVLQRSLHKSALSKKLEKKERRNWKVQLRLHKLNFCFGWIFCWPINSRVSIHAMGTVSVIALYMPS